MPSIRQNIFQAWTLTPEELATSHQLTTLNICNLQNLLADAAQEKVNIKFEPSNPLAFAQREAELQGQIGILSMLIELASPTLSLNFQE